MSVELPSSPPSNTHLISITQIESLVNVRVNPLNAYCFKTYSVLLSPFFLFTCSGISLTFNITCKERPMWNLETTGFVIINVYCYILLIETEYECPGLQTCKTPNELELVSFSILPTTIAPRTLNLRYQQQNYCNSLGTKRNMEALLKVCKCKMLVIGQSTLIQFLSQWTEISRTTTSIRKPDFTHTKILAHLGICRPRFSYKLVKRLQPRKGQSQ